MPNYILQICSRCLYPGCSALQPQSHRQRLSAALIDPWSVLQDTRSTTLKSNKSRHRKLNGENH